MMKSLAYESDSNPVLMTCSVSARLGQMLRLFSHTEVYSSSCSCWARNVNAKVELAGIFIHITNTSHLRSLLREQKSYE